MKKSMSQYEIKNKELEEKLKKKPNMLVKFNDLYVQPLLNAAENYAKILEANLKINQIQLAYIV